MAQPPEETFLSPPWPLKMRVGENSPSLWPDHVLGDEHRHVLLAVVHGDRQADHFRNDHRAARPGLDRLAIVLRDGRLHLLREVQVDERPLLQRTWHCLLPPLHDHVARALVATGLLALRLPAPRRNRVRVALAGLALATTVRMVDRVHHDAADRRADAAPALRAGLAVDAQAVFVVADSPSVARQSMCTLRVSPDLRRM